MISKTLVVEAVDENLNSVSKAVTECLEEAGASMKSIFQIQMALEELFVNVCHYAYAPETGDVTIKLVVDGRKMTMTFEDSGIPFDPVKKEDPDINAPLEQRGIGGLGIFMVKKSMDDLRYEYKDGKNVTTIEKNI